MVELRRSEQQPTNLDLPEIGANDLVPREGRGEPNGTRRGKVLQGLLTELDLAALRRVARGVQSAGPRLFEQGLVYRGTEGLILSLRGHDVLEFADPLQGEWTHHVDVRVVGYAWPVSKDVVGEQWRI